MKIEKKAVTEKVKPHSTMLLILKIHKNGNISNDEKKTFSAIAVVRLHFSRKFSVEKNCFVVLLILFSPLHPRPK